ncbi:MAG: hypothetical protein SangKO_041450 [Sandaracinaceae bacterium]
MPDAARQTDPVTHGGTIVTGSPNVLTEGLASARLFDLVKCDVHGTAVVAETSKTVLVNGRGFARKGDGCACEGASAAGPGQGDLVLFILSVHGSDKTLEEIVEETNGHGPHLEGILADSNRDGTLDSFVMDGSLMGFEIEGEHGRFAMEVGVLEGEATYVRGENAIDGPIPLNQRAKLNLRGSALDTEGTLNVTDEVSVEGKGSLFEAEVGGEFLAGSDGRYTGVIVDGGATASAASGSVTGVVDTTAGGFLAGLATSPVFGPAAIGALTVAGMSETGRELLATPVKIEVTKGASAASVGADGRFAAYYDNYLEEAHFDLAGELAVLLGLKAGVSVTIGGNGKEEGQTGDAGPNLIVSGAGTVIVGD